MAEDRGGKHVGWKLLKGGGTAELVERFTQEMTLLAEGLYEDQARLRRKMEELTDYAQKGTQEIQDLQQRMQAQAERLTVLERSVKRSAKWCFGGDHLGRVMLLAMILCGTVLAITVLRIFI